MTMPVDFKTDKNELNLFFILLINLLNEFKFYSSFEVLELIIKFLAFYIPLYVVVNMIFVHFYFFISPTGIPNTAVRHRNWILLEKTEPSMHKSLKL
jgi:hypothetical protein